MLGTVYLHLILVVRQKIISTHFASFIVSLLASDHCRMCSNSVSISQFVCWGASNVASSAYLLSEFFGDVFNFWAFIIYNTGLMPDPWTILLVIGRAVVNIPAWDTDWVCPDKKLAIHIKIEQWRRRPANSFNRITWLLSCYCYIVFCWDQLSISHCFWNIPLDAINSAPQVQDQAVHLSV